MGLMTGKTIATILIVVLSAAQSAAAIAQRNLSGDILISAINPVTPKGLPGSSIDIPVIRDSGMTKRQPTTVSYSTTITSSDYSSIVACPIPAALKCDDINGVVPGGVAKNCPDLCQVSRTEGPPDPGHGNVPYWTVAGACPAGYAQIGVFNMQKEYISNPASADIVHFPIPNWAKVTEYQGYGWPCTTGDVEYWTYCVQGRNYNGSSGYTAVVASPRNGNPTVGKWNVLFSDSRSNQWDGSECFTDSYCSARKHNSRTDGPDWLGNYTVVDLGPDTACYDSGLYFWYGIPLLEVKCTEPPSSVLESGRDIPVSAVCTRVRDVWRNETRD